MAVGPSKLPPGLKSRGFPVRLKNPTSVAWEAHQFCGKDTLACQSPVLRKDGVSDVPAQALPLEVVLASNILDSLTAVFLAIAIGCEVSDPQVDADEVGHRDRSRFRHVHRDDQEPLAVLAEHEFALSLGKRQSLALV